MPNSYYSADEQSLRPLYGRAVNVIMNDHTRHTGILTSCGPSSLTLNGERTHRPVKRKRQATVKADKQPTEFDLHASTDYWGNLSIEPLYERNTIKAVIPLKSVQVIMPL